LSGQGSSVSSASGTNETKINIAGFGAASPTLFSGQIIDILDPFETTKYPTVKALSGVSSIFIGLISGSWRNTAAINTITFDTDVAGDIITGSRISLYGLKGS
jgi:hypothetical protein